MGDIEIRSQTVLVPGVARCCQQTFPAVATGFDIDFGLGLEWCWSGQDIDYSSNGVAAIESRARPLVDFDSCRLRYVYLIQGVVVEEAGRTGRNTILQV